MGGRADHTRPIGVVPLGGPDLCFNRSVTALYRKYRPQDFDEVVGQEAVVRTLRNAIVAD